MNSFKAYILFLFVVGVLQANPIAVDASRRSITMTSETVDIRVREGSSQVNGTYSFRQNEDDWPSEVDTHVIIFVPVILPINMNEADYVSPAVTVKWKTFTTAIRNDIALDGTPTFDVPLPKGWFISIYECSIPLSLIDKSFSITASYIQPHFKGDVSAYIPFNPPKNTSDSIISFHADPGFSIEKLGKSIFTKSSTQTIEFKPTDKHLLRVRCIPEG